MLFRSSSIMLVPKNTAEVFGSLLQISAKHDEILISCATVNDIEIIDTLTASQLNLHGTVNTLIGQ